MKTHILFTVGFLSTFLLVQSSLCLAGLFDIKKSVEGNITQMQANVISVEPKAKASEEMNREENVDITVNANTKFIGGTSLTELHKGDPVKVEYKEESGTKVAIKIEKMDGTLEKTKDRG